MKELLDGKIILVTIQGQDGPGITARLMNIIGHYKIDLLDMGQAVTHGLLSLSFVLGQSTGDALKDLLFEANMMGMQLSYKVLPALIKNQQQHKENEKFILTCVSPNEITASFVGDLASILAHFQINIERIDKISPQNFSSLEITTSLSSEIELKHLKEELLKVSTKHQIDVAFIKDNIFRRNKRLIVFDMDSTLIQCEVIDEMARAHGVYEEVAKITHQAMEGHMDFNASLKARIKFLKGLKVSQMDKILSDLALTPGAVDLIKTIKGLGFKVAIISGGFSFFADQLKKQLGLDYAFSNELEIINNELTGEVLGTIVNAEQKAILLKLIAQQENISLEQVVAVGDGANDIPMLHTAGLGIAFHAKDIVKRAAKQHLSHGPMTSILYFLGIPGPQ